MKQVNNILKTSGISVLAVVSLMVGVSASSAVQAGEWRTISGAACESYNEGNIVSSQIIRSERGINKTSTAGPHAIFCPLEVDNSNSPRNIEVWINYKKAASSSMNCQVKTNHYFGLPARSHSFSVPTGEHSIYRNVLSFVGGGAVVRCSLYDNDKIYAINYKSE